MASSSSVWTDQMRTANETLMARYAAFKVASIHNHLAIREWYAARLKRVYQAWKKSLSPHERKIYSQPRSSSGWHHSCDPNLVWIPKMRNYPSGSIITNRARRECIDSWPTQPQTQVFGVDLPRVYLPREIWAFQERELVEYYSQAPFVVQSLMCPFPLCDAAEPLYPWRGGQCDVYYHDPLMLDDEAEATEGGSSGCVAATSGDAAASSAPEGSEAAEQTQPPQSQDAEKEPQRRSRALSRELHDKLVEYAHRRAQETKDHPVPNYQNLIDPNMYLHHHAWVATDWLVQLSEGKGSKLKASYLSNIYDFDPVEHPDLYSTVHGVFEAALPLLAKLRRPALLLPGPLQTVIKMQKIFLHPGEEYEGVWHRDGDGFDEQIVAVILYYYRHDTAQEGGQLEFMDKEAMQFPFFLSGDCNPDSLSPMEARSTINCHPHCKVPVREGSLVVFSNYQMIHRVLRMRNNTGRVAARSFLCMFVVDQRSPLPSSSNPGVLKSIARFDLAERKERRQARLLQQLQPAGKIGMHGVYHTGNGSATLLGWMDEQGQVGSNSIQEMFDLSGCQDRMGLFNLGVTNICPPLHRGVSWAASFQLHFGSVSSLQRAAHQVIKENELDTSELPEEAQRSLAWFKLMEQVSQCRGRDELNRLLGGEQLPSQQLPLKKQPSRRKSKKK